MPGILPMKMIRVGSSTQSRIAQACDRCRSKKIRCDGIRPTCTQCANVGFECKTSDKLSRRAFPRGYTESLEDRVRGLEAEVRELKQLLDEKDEKIDMLSRLHSFSPSSRKGSSSLSPGNAAQIKAEVESAREDALHIEIPAPVQEGTPSTGTSTTSAFVDAFEQKIQEHDRRPENMSSAKLVTQPTPPRQAQATSSKTPPRILSDQYINLFFQEWQPLLPIFHRPTFLRVYEQYLAGPDAGNWHANRQAIAQLFLIFEIAALSSGHQAKVNSPTYENHWKKGLYSSSSTPTITSIQCQVLAQLCYLLRADYTHLVRHRGIAVGMCHELGLHQGHRYHTLTTFDAETRRKVFWCQYVLDKFTSAATGTPMLLRDEDISTDFPADVDDENLNAQGFSPTLPGELTKISSALALFKATKILSRTLTHLYSAKASYQLSISKLHGLSDELDQWSEELPEHQRLRFANDKPATNLISCRSPILSLLYFYIRGLIHRPLLCHGSGSACSAATIVLAAAGKHTLQILDLLDERRMNYTFPLSRREIILTAAFSILWQSIDLEEDSKLVKDNQKSLSLALGMLARESQTSASEFQRIASPFVQLDGRRVLSPKHIEINSPAAKLINTMPAPSTATSEEDPKSTRKQLQAIASKFSSFKGGAKPEEPPRRATIPSTGKTQSLSPQHRAGSTVSLSSTRSAPVVITPLAGASRHMASTSTTPSHINLDYFPFGNEINDPNTSASSSTMLPPKRPVQMSPNIANASWDNLLNTFDGNNTALFGSTNAAHTPMSTDWMQDNWGLPSVEFPTKAPVPQSLLSFSGESMTSNDDVVFSASSHNGSTSTTESVDVGSGGVGGETFKGIAIPMDDDFDFDALES